MDEPALPTTSSDINQANNDTTNVVPKDNGPDPSETYPFPGNSCVQCQWYFCPPLDSVTRILFGKKKYVLIIVKILQLLCMKASVKSTCNVILLNIIWHI